MRFVVVLALIAATSTVRAESNELETARQLEAQLEYERALAIVDKILARGGSDPVAYAELELFAGKLAAGLERPQLAEAHFGRAIAVKPDLALPDGTSPKITEPFARAKSRKLPLLVTARSKQGLVTIEATDALGMIRGISVHVRVGDKHADLVERSALRVVIGKDAEVVEVSALDVNGNRLWVGAPLVDTPRVVTPVTRRELRPRLTRWPTWAAITGVALFGGAVAAWRFDSAQNEFDRRRIDGMTDFSELERIEARGKRWSVAANISFGVAAVAAIATTIFAVRGSSYDVIVTPAGVNVTARF